MAEEGASLTGVWDGVYSYPFGRKTTPFTAVVLEFGSAFSGTVHERPEDGPLAGQTINAEIEGSRSAAHVMFAKSYLDTGPRYRNKVVYEGELNADLTQITGRWRIPGNWSGPFVMTRPRPPSAAIAMEHKEMAPADV
ncbi:MAG: hypothetical protein ACXU82_02590 [Caulobacteraceae bacterium]